MKVEKTRHAKEDLAFIRQRLKECDVDLAGRLVVRLDREAIDTIESALSYLEEYQVTMGYLERGD